MIQENNAQRIKLPHKVICRASGLLPMKYKVREIAEDLQMPERTLRDWLKREAPHERDPSGRIWVNGEKFTEWVTANKGKKSKVKLNDDQAYCLHCKESVKLLNPQTKRIKGKLIHIKGQCSFCGCTINRGGRLG